MAGSQNSPPISRTGTTSAPAARNAEASASSGQNTHRGYCRALCANRDFSRPASTRARTMRTGERASSPGKRQVSRGSSATTVPRPTRMASERARKRCPAARAASPVAQTGLPAMPRGTDPAASSASLAVTSGRRSVTRRICPAAIQCAASTSTPRSTARPALRNRARPRPATRGSGSSMAHTTRASPAPTMASAHGGVMPWCEHGSSVTYMVAPRARSPACAMAMVSACGRPPGAVQARAMTSPVRSSAMTAPTEGLGAVRPRPRAARPSAICIIWASKPVRSAGRITLNAS